MKQAFSSAVRQQFSAVSRLAPRALILALVLGLPARLKAADIALTFTNNTHYVSTTGRVSSLSFTVEAWVRPTTFIGENQVASQYDGSAGRMIFGLRNTKASFFIGGTWLDGNAALTLNAWTHIAVTRTGGNATLYVNGALDKASTTFPTNALPPANFMIGGISSLNSGFRGQIAEVRAWNVVRTQTQIQGGMSNRLAGGEANLTGCWRLDEGMGSFVLDHAANANGIITGATWTYGTGLPVAAGDPAGFWRSATGGNWSDAANWVGATLANGAGAAAFFTNNPPATITVSNDMAALQLGRVLLSGTAGYTFTGNGLTLTNQFAQAMITSTNGAHTFGVPVTTSAGSVMLDTRAPASLAFTSVISGPGGFAVNPVTTGGGTVSFTGANTFTGSVSLSYGTLAINSLANAGTASALGASSSAPANLLIGPATLSYTGPAATTDRGFTMQPGSGRASILSVDTNAAFGGVINSLTGASIKRGKGTLTFTGAGPNVLSRTQAGDMSAFAEYPASGDSPVNGFGGLTVADGKLVLGAPGQTNTIGGEAWVGGRTTYLAGKETTAEMEIIGGYTRMNSFLCVGRDNGDTNTAPVPLQPRLTLTDGTLSVVNLIITYGGHANHNTRGVLDIRGGSFEVDTQFRLGDQRGNAAVPAFATLNVYGGAVRHAHATEGITFGWRDPAASGTLNLFGGLVDEVYRVKMGQYGSRSELNLHGGILRAQNIVQSNPTTNNIGQSHLFLNGGVFQPNLAGQTLSGLTSATVSTNGARFDTSLADFTVNQNLLHDSALGAGTDGGLVKLGTNTLTLLSYGSTYTGPTVVSNGILCVAGAASAASALTVAPGGEALIGGSATQTVTVAALTLDDDGLLSFAFTADGASYDRLAVTASPVLAYKRIALYLLNTRLPFTHSGTYTNLTYTGADPDVSGLTCANPVYGKAYTFASGSGAVTVTVASDTSTASIWNVNASGTWGTGANWTVAQPGTAGSSARFDDAISSPVSIVTAGETAGELFLNNVNAYTLAGTGLTLDNNAEPAAITVESGSHAVAAPLTLAGNATLNLAPSTRLTLDAVSGAAATLTAQGNGTLALTAPPNVQSLTLDVAELAFTNTLTLAAPVALQRAVIVRPAMSTTVTVSSVVSGIGGLSKAGSNVLALASANTYTGVTRVDGGTLDVPTLANGGQPSSIGASPAANGNLVLGAGTLRYTGPSATIDRGYTLNPGSARSAVLFTQTNLTFAGKIQGTSGGLVKTGPGTLAFTYPGAQTLGVNENALVGPTLTGPFGDSPATNFQALTILNGKVVVGVPGQTNTVSARMCVGYYSTTAPGAETAGELEINGGAFTCNSTVSLGRNNGNTTTAPGGLTSRITINGGAVTFSLLALGYNGISGFNNFNARPVCDVNAGSLTLNSYCNIGETVGSTATLNIRGGTVLVKGLNATGNAFAGLCVGGTGSGGTGILNISGTGVVYCANYVNLATVSGSTGTLNLDGGFLSASNIVKGTGSSATLRFNGGIYQPTATNSAVLGGLTAAYVSTNGALIDTSMASYTVTQNLLHEPGLGALTDGGLVKLGTNTLALIGTNTMNGRIDLRAGALRARVSATNDLNVATNAFFDALGLRATVGDLTGNGTLTNGVIALAGALDAGTNGAPAGARMTVENLSLVQGSAFVCTWSTNALGHVTNDFVTVTGTLAPEGAGFVDFGCTEAAPLPMPFRATVMSFGTLGGTGAFAGWRARNTGLTKPMVTVITTDNHLVTLTVRYSGTLLLVK